MRYSRPTELIKCPRRALDTLTRYLARRDHSEKELRQKMGRRFAKAVIDSSIQTAKDRKWLADPQVLSDRWVESLHRKGKSHRYIQNFLQQKDLPAPRKDSEAEAKKALEILKFKFRRVDQFDFELSKKAFRFLANRGFDEATTRQAIQKFKLDLSGKSFSDFDDDLLES